MNVILNKKPRVPCEIFNLLLRWKHDYIDIVEEVIF